MEKERCVLMFSNRKKKWKNLKFYLAGPIGDVKDNSYKTWREDIEKFLESLGHRTNNPLKFQGRSGDFKEELFQLRKERKYNQVKEFMEKFLLPHDRMLVKKSDVIIAYVPSYTVGTLREISLAYEWKKPILVVTRKRFPSNSLIGMATKMFNNFKELKEYILSKSKT